MLDAATKRALVSALRAQIAQEIGLQTRAARDAADAATHEEAKPENDKDTRGLEASYLARGQAERVRELERNDNALQFLPLRDFAEGAAVDLGALALLESEGTRTVYFLAPAGGGMRATVDGVEIQVVTPPSPFGRAIAGRHSGETVEVRVRGKAREYVVLSVS